VKRTVLFVRRIITQLPAGSRLSGKKLRKRRSRSAVTRIRGLTETGWSGWNSRSGIQDNSHLILGHSPCDEPFVMSRDSDEYFRRGITGRARIIPSPILLPSLMHSKSIHFETRRSVDTEIESWSSIAIWETYITELGRTTFVCFPKLNFMTIESRSMLWNNIIMWYCFGTCAISWIGKWSLL